jgi:hypothetical protein
MMNSIREVQEALCEALAAETDEFLREHGFARANRSLEYVRVCQDGQQTLRMDVDFKPSYQLAADCRIYPWICVIFPEVNRLAIEMVGGNRLLIPHPDITFSQPFDTIMPRGANVRWYTFGSDSIPDVLRSIKGALQEFVIPFADDYRTIDSLASAYVKRDERLLWVREFYVDVAAAYLLLGRPGDAMQVLEKTFRRPGARRKYAAAFEYVAARLKKP